MPFHPLLLDAARESVREVEGHDVELPSGALHDASEVAREIPTVMIFSSSIAGEMMTSPPVVQFTGVDTLCLALSCNASSTRRISSMLRPIAAG